LDLRGSLPCFIHVTTGAVHDVNVLDLLPLNPGCFYILDRGYLDFGRLHSLTRSSAFFVTRTKRNTRYRRLCSQWVNKKSGLRCDQTVVLTGFYAKRDYPDKLRIVKYVDLGTGKRFTFLTNNFCISALTVAELYKCRWQVELFFKWLKQHLRIKAFFGTTENAVKTQVWIAVSVYVLVAITKKRLNLTDASLYTILQILSVSLFEKKPILQALIPEPYLNLDEDAANQLELFNC
jgi:IS4 transposase